MENTKEDRKKTCLYKKKTVSIFDSKDKNRTNNYKNVRCCNCNEYGHIVKYCTKPITSYGIVLYRKNKDINKLEYLLICRKHSIGYIEFIRGNYNINNTEYLLKIFKTMTRQEIQNINTELFKTLWSNLWNNKNKFNNEYTRSRQKFYNLKNNKYSIGIQDLINKTTQHGDPEWGFPKGRKNINETNIQAAKREVYEETNITSSNYNIKKRNNDYITFIEEYNAFNNKTYKLIYYIAEIKSHLQVEHTTTFNKYQQNEISKLGFYPLETIVDMIRPYYLEKIKLIHLIDDCIQKEYNK
jgi:8-oxo-dGTP pyrophosphatase MutT (NUDIX family)